MSDIGFYRVAIERCMVGINIKGVPMSVDPALVSQFTAAMANFKGAADQASTLGASIIAQLGGTTTTPPPPPPPASIVVVVAPSTQKLTDSGGHVYQFGTSFQDDSSIVWGDHVVVDGAQGSGIAAAMALVGGSVFFLSSTGQWSPSVPSPAPILATADGTSVTDIGGFVIDATDTVFMLANHPDPTYGCGVVVNGQILGSIGTMKLSTYSGIAWSVDAKGVWASWNGKVFVTQAKGPV